MKVDFINTINHLFHVLLHDKISLSYYFVVVIFLIFFCLIFFLLRKIVAFCKLKKICIKIALKNDVKKRTIAIYKQKKEELINQKEFLEKELELKKLELDKANNNLADANKKLLEEKALHNKAKKRFEEVDDKNKLLLQELQTVNNKKSEQKTMYEMEISNLRNLLTNLETSCSLFKQEIQLKDSHIENLKNSLENLTSREIQRKKNPFERIANW